MAILFALLLRLAMVVLIGYALVHRFDWINGLAALCGYLLLVDAMRTKAS